ncbi:hypothetical protein L195_g042577, partial [Trifolium pratense]
SCMILLKVTSIFETMTSEVAPLMIWQGDDDIGWRQQFGEMTGSNPRH